MQIIIISLVYVLGYALAFCMLRIEQEADQEVYTKGDRVACMVLSLLSFVTVLGLLVAAWVRMVNESGYWNRPVIKEEVALADNRPHTIRTEPINDEDDE